MASPQASKNIFASVRAARIAVLVNSADPDWQETSRRIIELLSSTWGGKYSLIVPTDGEIISPTFWKLLETYDPDYIYCYQKTLRDLKISKPSEYSLILEAQLKEAYPDKKWTDETRDRWDRGLSQQYFGGFGVYPKLCEELKTRLAPFFFEDSVADNTLVARGEVVYPLTDLSTVLPNWGHAETISLIEPSAASPTPLWVEAVTGSLYPEYAEKLIGMGIIPNPVTTPAGTENKLFNFVMTGSTRIGRNYQGGEFGDSLLIHNPFAFSMAGLSEYLPTTVRRISHVVVIGSAFEDFALYFCLSRLRQRVYWILPEWISEFETVRDAQLAAGVPESRPPAHPCRHFVDSLLAVRGTDNQRINFLSVSQGSSQISDLIDRLEGVYPGSLGRIRNVADIPPSIDHLIEKPQVVYNTGNYPTPANQRISENSTLDLFPTPKPRGFDSIVPYEHRWIAELSTEGYLLPRHPSLGTWNIRHHTLTSMEARTGLRGFCYCCPSSAYFGGDVDSILVRPQVFLPGAQETIERIAEAAKRKVRTSDKGFYSRETIRKFSGLDAAAQFLRTPATRAIFEEFLVRPPGAQRERGVFLQ